MFAHDLSVNQGGIDNSQILKFFHVLDVEILVKLKEKNVTEDGFEEQ
jgi:hypothetical protein